MFPVRACSDGRYLGCGMALEKSEELRGDDGGGDDDLASQDAPPRKRRRWGRLVLVLLVLLLIGGEVAASWGIATKLKSTVASKLDAKLKFGLLVYIPPYGAWA